MRTVNVYKCKECGERFEATTKGQVCPECGSMNIAYVGRKRNGKKKYQVAK